MLSMFLLPVAFASKGAPLTRSKALLIGRELRLKDSIVSHDYFPIDWDMDYRDPMTASIFEYREDTDFSYLVKIEKASIVEFEDHRIEDRLVRLVDNCRAKVIVEVDYIENGGWRSYWESVEKAFIEKGILLTMSVDRNLYTTTIVFPSRSLSEQRRLIDTYSTL